MRLLLVVPLLVLTACAARPGGGSDAGAQPPAGGSNSGSATLGDHLDVTVDRGDGREPEQYTLSCGSDDAGSLPDARAACDHLAGLDDPFAPLPADAVCTEIYGGPQTARVTGTWDGEPVDLELSRVDGCHIAQWDALGPPLPGPVGVEPPN